MSINFYLLIYYPASFANLYRSEAFVLHGWSREQADSFPIRGHPGGGRILPGGHQQHPQQRGSPQSVQAG